MGNLSERLKKELTDAGASLVGFADLRGIPAEQRDGFDYAVSIAAAIKPEVINGIGTGPTKEYYNEYYSLSKLLDDLDRKAAEIIISSGYTAVPKVRSSVKIEYRDHSTILPHKTVATRAGLGWIGKCAMLVTPQYGSAVRISSVLTDAPLEVAEAINKSSCGACNNCVRNCPGEALSGDAWDVFKKRETFYDWAACRNKAIERTWRVSPGETQCGLCVLVCPWTKKYINAAGLRYSFPAVEIAQKGDYEEILQLQKLAFRSVAEVYNDFTISPLVQTMESLTEEAKRSVILKIVEDRKIIGSVRAFEKDGTCYIARLMVHPDFQNRGIGKKLLEAIERCFGGVRYELFTGNLLQKNLSFYEKQGYRKFKTEPIDENGAFNGAFIYMEKESMSDLD